MRLSKKVSRIAKSIGKMEVKCRNCAFYEECSSMYVQGGMLKCMLGDILAEAAECLKGYEDNRLENAKALKQFAEEKWKEEEAYKKKLVKQLDKVIGELDE